MFRLRYSSSTWRRPTEPLGSSRRGLNSWNASTLRLSRAWRRPYKCTSRPSVTCASRSPKSSASPMSSTKLASRRMPLAARTRSWVVSFLNCALFYNYPLRPGFVTFEERFLTFLNFGLRLFDTQRYNFRTDDLHDARANLTELNRRLHELEIELRRLENEREELTAAYKEAEAVSHHLFVFYKF